LADGFAPLVSRTRSRSLTADFQLSSLPACTAWSTANKSAGRFASPLPDGCFLQPPDQCFLARRLLPPVRNRSLVTAFRSPATTAASRRPPFRGQSSQPATSLPSRSLPCPFGPSAPLPRPGLRRLRPLHCLGPVALPLPGSASRAHSLHSPPGFLRPSGSKRSTAFAACRSA